jgi:hypothetical protein
MTEVHMLNTSQIQEHMEVVGADGVHVGTVDRLEGADTIKLTKSDPASDGKHRFVPVDWVDHVDTHVHLKKDSDELQAYWKKH